MLPLPPMTPPGALVNVPALLSGELSVELRFHCAPVWLFTTALLSNVTRPALWFTVPALFQVRPSRVTNPVTFAVPLVVSTPGPPAIVPADQLRTLVVMPSVPLSTPPETIKGLVKLTVGPAVLKSAVPLLISVLPVPAML